MSGHWSSLEADNFAASPATGGRRNPRRVAKKLMEEGGRLAAKKALRGGEEGPMGVTEEAKDVVAAPAAAVGGARMSRKAKKVARALLKLTKKLKKIKAEGGKKGRRTRKH